MAAAQNNYVSVSRRQPDVEDYIDIFRRYRSWIIGPMFAGLVIAVVVAFLYPDTYVSTALMRITPQQISASLVPTVVNMQMAQRLQQMQTDIESRGSLADIIQRPALDLYKKERARLPMEDVIQEMRNKIRIQPIVDSGAGRVASAFTISFSYPDRFKAQAVVRELVTKFTEGNFTVQRNQATLTTDFLNGELKTARDRMVALEAAITKFKAENLGRLPEQFQANVAQLQSLQMQLSNANESLSRNQQQKLQIETQLQNYNTQLNYYTAQGEDTITLAGPAAVRNERLNNLNQRIMDQQAKVASMAELMTDANPDLRQAHAQLASLEKQKADAEREDLALQAAAAATTQPQVRRVPNLQNQKMVQDLQGSIAMLKTEIQGINLQMDEKLRQVTELNRQIVGANSRIESSPQLEQQYASLVRDYGMSKQTYEEMSKRSEQSETAKDLENIKAGENLELVDAPSDPTTASEPDRPKWAAIGAGFGLMLGVVLAAGKEMKNTSLKNLKDVRAYTNLPVLSSIPLLENALQVRRKRRLQWLAWSSAIILGSIAMSGSAYYYYSGHNT